MGKLSLLTKRCILVHTWWLHSGEELFRYSKASSYVVYGSRKKPCNSRTVYHEAGKTPKNLLKIHMKCSKFSKIRVYQVFLEPIQNRVSPSSANLEAAYLEVLLYINTFSYTWTYLILLCHFQISLSQKLWRKHLTLFSIFLPVPTLLY